MQNPFTKAAAEILGRVNEKNGEQDAATAAGVARKLEEEDTFKEAATLFDRMVSKVRDCARLANEAFGREDVVLKVKAEPVKKNAAGVATVSLENDGITAFRFVGNASFKAYIHDVGDPKLGALDLRLVDELPYQEAFERFLHEASKALEKRTGA